ncbi:MAG: TlpA family protein disulfide reductase [Luteimonas sp.]
MNRIVPLSIVLAGCLSAAAASAQEAQPAKPGSQASPSASELAFRHQLMLDDYARVEFRDEAGNAITFEDLLRAIPAGKSFSIEKDSDHSLATVRIGSKHDDADEPAPQALQVGQALPAPEGLRTLDGHAFGSAELQGRRTLLSLYFAECLPCIAEVPELNRLAAAHPEMGVYAVTFDDAATAQAFVAQRGLQLPVVADANAYLDALGVQTYPTLVLLDETGRIAAVRHGGKMPAGDDKAGDGGDDDAGIAAWVAASFAPQAAPAP